MKTKLSFLALPLCLGMVLTFVLAACDGGKDSPGDELSSGSGGGSVITNPSSEVKSDSIVFDDKSFGTDLSGDKMYITGKIYGTVDLPIVKLEFKPNNLISYDDDIDLPATNVTLTGRVYIDLTSSSLSGCGTKQYIEIKACTDQNCKGYATKNVEYVRPDRYCAASSSSVTAASSSSKTVWKFGQITTVDVPYNTKVDIGSGSFKLSGDDGQPDIEVTGGKIRLATALCGSDDVEPGKEYSSEKSCLGSEVPTTNSLGGDLGVQMGEFYLIYYSDSKYLVQFEKKTSWIDWPKKCNFWMATVSP